MPTSICLTLERRTPFSSRIVFSVFDGPSPETPTVLPFRSLDRLDASDFFSQISEFSGRLTIAAIDLIFGALVLRGEHVARVGDAEIDATGLDLLDHAGRVRRHLRVDDQRALLERAVGDARVDPGVVGVGLPVEHQVDLVGADVLGRGRLGLLAAAGEQRRRARAMARIERARFGWSDGSRGSPGGDWLGQRWLAAWRSHGTMRRSSRAVSP